MTDRASLPASAEAWRRRGRVVDVFGIGVFAVEAGPADATPLLVLHGYPTSSLDYAGVIDALAARWRVIVHDHPGFGLSDKPADYSYSLVEQAEVAAGLWRALGASGGHVLAHDYGTSVATELIARRERGALPLDLRSLTLCNGSVHIELAQPRLIQKLLRNPVLGPTVARLSSRGTFEKNMRAILAKPEVLADADIDAMWELLERADGRARLPAITRYLDERVRYWHRWIGALTRLDLPTHVLWGPLDPVARLAVAEALHAEIPGSTLTLLEGLGHYPMLEDPGRWTAAALGFLDRVEPP